MSGADGVPSFAELPVLEGLQLRHAWDVYGRDDQLGSLNQLTPARRVAAAQLVTTGEVVNLVIPLNAIEPPMFDRSSLEHTIFAPDRNSLDDRLDSFYLQGSSQWDGLRHIRAREFGFWGGRTDASAFVGAEGGLGVEHWVKHGFVGRGVLLDVARYFADRGESVDPFRERAIDGSELNAVAAHQECVLQPGDIVCVRFGWMARYLALTADERRAGAGTREYIGLHAGEDMSRWLWDRQLAAIACDNPSVEVAPGSREVGSLHRRTVPLLGLALGELYDFDNLAERCVADRRWEFLFVSVPLHLPGGVGSPANAIAVR